MNSASDLREAEEFLHTQIPVTRAMGVRVVSDGSSFAVEAPVELNHNHLQTAFGGSINSMATLAGYTLLWLELRDKAAHLVVRESTIRFLRPVRMTIRGVCIPPTDEQLAGFREALTRNSKARLQVQVRIEEDGEVTAQFRGTFVAFANASGTARDGTSVR